MTDENRLKKLETMRQQFVNNVSHELKTPITLIKGALETLQKEVMANDRQQTLVDISYKHANRLHAIVEELLQLSKIEHDHTAIHRSIQSVTQCISHGLQVLSESAEKKNITLLFNSDQTIKALINAALIEQAVINLVSNAIKYSPEHSEITIQLKETPSQVIITVSDHGMGIPKENLPFIFNRFYRVDEARNRDTGGTGLGLAIVKHVAAAHEGAITVKSTPKKGSTFHLSILKGSDPSGSEVPEQG